MSSSAWSARPWKPEHPLVTRPHPAATSRDSSCWPAALLDPREVEAELDGPAVVRSGHTLRHGLLLRNHTGDELQIPTNGHVTAGILDPLTGEVVGGFSGWQTPLLVMFRIAPGGTKRIPLLIGTASFAARLGYAVPPGRAGCR
jgi:hypothetical protein